MKRGKDKRLIIPKDAFEEEASEGLGRLNKDEAAEDLRDLEGRMEKRLREPGEGMAKRMRRPLRIWMPAAAAVTVILIASTVYIGLFRDRQPALPETAMVEESKNDTVLIAMALPISKGEDENKAEVKDKITDERVRYVAAVVAEEDIVADEALAEIMDEEKVRDGMIIEILEPKELVEEVIVQAVPERSKAAQGIPATRAERVVPDHAPQPIGGIEVLNTWISSNINYPADVLSQTVQQVIVSFKVSADSTVYNLKAEQTPGESYTEEAFRLLHEGPKWAPAVRNGTFSGETVRVRISFREQ